MALHDILPQNGVLFELRACCKREALSAIAARAADIIDAPAENILTAIMDREQLGSTGVGEGVALPHAKMDGLARITGLLARLEKPVSFDAVDDQPVDIIFALLAPANANAAHLKALARVSRLFKDSATVKALRGADSAESLYALAVADRKHDAA